MQEKGGGGYGGSKLRSEATPMLQSDLPAGLSSMLWGLRQVRAAAMPCWRGRRKGASKDVVSGSPNWFDGRFPGCVTVIEGSYLKLWCTPPLCE